MGEGRPAVARAAVESRVDRRKAATAAAILKAAERHFLARGFYAAKIEDIARDADVATGSIYVHFGSKEGLYLALLERALQVEERYLAAAFDPSVPATDRLVAAGEAYLRFYLEHPGYFRMLAFPTFVQSWKKKPTPVGIRIARLAEAQINRLADAIAAAVDAGLVRKVDPQRAAKFLWGAWVGVISLNTRPDRLRIKDEELASVLEEGRAMISFGLAAAVPPVEQPRKLKRRRGGRA
jgi:TetR/AcrR family transcriptional regulator